MRKTAIWLIVFAVTSIIIFAVGSGSAGVDLGDVELKDPSAYSAEDNQSIGVLTRELWILRKEYQRIDSDRAAAAAVYAAQLDAKQDEIDSKEQQLLAAQTN